MNKKTPVKVAPPKKSAAKPSAAKSAPAKKAAAKVVAKAAPAKKPAVKVAAKVAPAKAAPAKKPAAKAAAKAAPAKKPAAKAAAKAAPATKAAAKAAPAKKSAEKKAPARKTAAKKVPAAKPSATNAAPPSVVQPALEKSANAAAPAIAKIERETNVVERRAVEPVLRATPPSDPIAPRGRTIVAPAASASSAPSLPSPLKRARAVNRPDPQGADALFLAHATAAGLEGATVEGAWARMPLFAPLLALALVRQGADALVHATIRGAATEVPDADVVDALAALSAPSRRAATTLAEARDEAILARKPARASLLDAIQHALEGALAREEGDAAMAYERGIEVGRALTAAVALARRLDASEPEQRAEVVRALHERILRLSPALPAIG